MRAILFCLHAKMRKIILLLLVIAANPANAVFIDFDDIKHIPADDEFPHFSDHPLTDQYIDKGLLIEGGFLVGESLPDGSNDNQLLGSNWLSLRFVDALPTFVSMNISAGAKDVVYINVYGESGWLMKKQTSGYAGPDNDTPYTDNQLVSIDSSEAISFITIEAFYNLRVSATVDNLFYESRSSVPEPSQLILLISGLLMLAVSGFSKRKASVEK